jgi:hypothetical protein
VAEDFWIDTGDLHRPLYCADILANALNQDPGRPLLHLLDGPVNPWVARCNLRWIG